MLVEQGFVKAETSDGREFTFRPSLGRISSLGSPHEIVAIYARLHGPKAAPDAAYVLACLCDQEDVTPLIGESIVFESGPARGSLRLGESMPPPSGWRAGLMSASEQVLIARHLMRHGLMGKARPGKNGKASEGKYVASFDAAEYIAAARVHLGLSSKDAADLSMTEFQAMFEMKFPQAGNQEKDLPSREEYRAARKAYMEHRERKRG